MVECYIKSTSNIEDVQTTNTYKYYYCPTEQKRIRVHVKHETIKEARVDDSMTYWDGAYATLLSFKARSNSIKSLNFGELFPNLYVYGENDIIKEFILDQNPNYKTTRRFLTAKDECVLGKEAWVSVDNQEKIHALVNRRCL